MKKHVYIYEGPILEFDRCISSKWVGETTAETEKAAKRNLAYQFKKQNNRTMNARISLPGTIKIIN